MATTTNSKLIYATPEKIYQAFTDPRALETWQAPGDMTGKVYDFDLREGSGYTMSLFYPASDKKGQGKTAINEDRYTATFLQLVPGKRIVQSTRFDTTDPSFAGDMLMAVDLEEKDNATLVTVTFKNIPAGIRPEDNEKGTELSLEKLAEYVS